MYVFLLAYNGPQILNFRICGAKVYKNPHNTNEKNTTFSTLHTLYI